MKKICKALETLLADIKFRICYMPIECGPGATIAALPIPDFEGAYYTSYHNFLQHVRMADTIYNSAENNHR